MDPNDERADFNPALEFTHTCLKHLCFGTDYLFILRYLTLPALQSLSLYIGGFDFTYDHFVAFLNRSSPPLQSLELQITGGWSRSMLEDFFRLVPNLTDLDISYEHIRSQEFFPFFETLAPVEFLPKLHNLMLHGFTRYRLQPEKLVAMLSARRAHSGMRSFRLVFSQPDDFQPDADALVALRQLATDGMEIHISHSEESENMI